MRTTNFDAIAAAAPLDRSASVVRDGSGDAYEGKVPSWHEHWTAPPLPEGRFSGRNGGDDLTGVRFGRGMVVVRYHRSHRNGAQWLVRCPCGDYELRRSKAVRSADDEHVCQACDWFRHVQYQRDAERKGKTAAIADAARLDQLATGRTA